MEPYQTKDTYPSRLEDSYIYKEEAYLRAKKKVEKLVGFYWHLASYVIVNLFIIITIAVANHGNIWNFGTFATAIFWGVGLGFHALGVFGPDLLFGKHWEERKIKEFMEKDQQKWQ
ncbi:2TM domain-containing protein [Mangrovimonas sp. YM274]|uniref:2TM domain-containing protein n=1 Tax=Mangrovimonas sp. YM274 TaxID=3070660 RepID=UPI0027DE00EA|nr:2TM domain-containing protein [Mangrovimonas sp. YM274]WMI69885.1 2TM domain-containing protein [Mangrovimonas sp. YM274]